MAHTICGWIAMLTLLVAGRAQADEPCGRFDYEAAFDARLIVLAAIAGDDGHPPWMLSPGVGVMVGETFSIRIDGEVSKKDIGDGYGFGAYAGVGLSGKGAAIASGVIAAVGLSLFAIALGQLGA